jgi:hypothetical protein
MYARVGQLSGATASETNIEKLWAKTATLKELTADSITGGVVGAKTLTTEGLTANAMLCQRVVIHDENKISLGVRRTWQQGIVKCQLCEETDFGWVWHSRTAKEDGSYPEFLVCLECMFASAAEFTAKALFEHDKVLEKNPESKCESTT